MDNKNILEDLVQTNENIKYSFPENIKNKFIDEESFIEQFEDKFEMGYIDWNEKYGRSLDVGDEVLFVFENSAASFYQKESFVNMHSGILKIIDINRKTGRFTLDGDYAIYPEYKGKFTIKSGVSDNYPRGYGSIKILVKEKYEDLNAGPIPRKNKGKIEKYFEDKGYGFIKGMGIKYFFHISSLENGNYSRVVREGINVKFNSNYTEKGPCAINIEVRD